MATLKAFIFAVTTLQLSTGDDMAPFGADHEHRMNCEEFGRFARFNIYSVLDGPWRIFYYWSPQRFVDYDFNFTAINTRDLQLLKEIFNSTVKETINWNDTKAYMGGPMFSVMVETGDRGQHDLYAVLPKDSAYLASSESQVIEPVKAVFKQKGKYIGLMLCQTFEVFLLVRKRDMPRKDEVQEAAAVVGYRGKGGKSYLYQGNDWMPVGDADEEEVYGPGMKYL